MSPESPAPDEETDPLAGGCPHDIDDDPHVEQAQRAHDRELRAVYIARGVICPAPDES